jgi:hypothetical protein
MGSDDTDKQPVTWTTAIIAAVLVFLAVRYAAGFDTWLSVGAGLAVGAIAIVMRRRMMSQK